MLRKLLIGFGLVEIVKPAPIIDACERIGLANPEEAQLRTRALDIARIEGLFVVWLLLRGRRRAPLVSAFFTVVGTVALLFPRPLIRITQRLAYENTDDLELEPWVGPAARGLGLLYLLLVVLSGDGSPETSDSAGAEPSVTESAAVDSTPTES